MRDAAKVLIETFDVMTPTIRSTPTEVLAPCVCRPKHKAPTRQRAGSVHQLHTRDLKAPSCSTALCSRSALVRAEDVDAAGTAIILSATIHLRKLRMRAPWSSWTSSPASTRSQDQPDSPAHWSVTFASHANVQPQSPARKAPPPFYLPPYISAPHAPSSRASSSPVLSSCPSRAARAACRRRCRPRRTWSSGRRPSAPAMRGGGAARSSSGPRASDPRGSRPPRTASRRPP